jgi:hypothetical protein
VNLYYEIGDRVWYLEKYELKLSDPIKQIQVDKEKVVYSANTKKFQVFLEEDIVCKYNEKQPGSIEFEYSCKTEYKAHETINKIVTERDKALQTARKLIEKTYD